jgi:hypothetical protein
MLLNESDEQLGSAMLLLFLTENSRSRFTRAQLQQLCKGDSANRLHVPAKSVGNLLGLLIKMGKVTVQEGEGTKSTYGTGAVAAVRREPTRKELKAERRQALIDHVQTRPLKTAPRPKFKSLRRLGYKTASFGQKQTDRQRVVEIAGTQSAVLLSASASNIHWSRPVSHCDERSSAAPSHIWPRTLELP